MHLPADPYRVAANPAVPPWPCLVAARTQGVSRVAWQLPWQGGAVTVGSVEAERVPLLLAQWPDAWRHTDGALHLTVPAAERTAALAQMGRALRDQGLVRAWRDEPYGLWDAAGRSHAQIERATARFWGSLTLGAHCNGYQADAQGRPTHLWIAQRALDKPTDPGMLDNLIGGGVPWGQRPSEALLREAWEEAGLRPEHLAGLQRGSVLELRCDIPEGLQHEWLHIYDLALPPGVQPCNQDGEVAQHRAVPVDLALDLAAAGALTVDAALATLDFALRHGLLVDPGLARALDALRVPAVQSRCFDPA
jgi:8-oxo-dGTP pyrophosphatase MutT (NUDIX family)